MNPAFRAHSTSWQHFLPQQATLLLQAQAYRAGRMYQEAKQMGQDALFGLVPGYIAGIHTSNSGHKVKLWGLNLSILFLLGKQLLSIYERQEEAMQEPLKNTHPLIMQAKEIEEASTSTSQSFIGRATKYQSGQVLDEDGQEKTALIAEGKRLHSLLLKAKSKNEKTIEKIKDLLLQSVFLAQCSRENHKQNIQLLFQHSIIGFVALMSAWRGMQSLAPSQEFAMQWGVALMSKSLILGLALRHLSRPFLPHASLIQTPNVKDTPATQIRENTFFSPLLSQVKAANDLLIPKHY